MNTIVFFDLDATVIHVGDRFINNPPPLTIEKDRTNPVYQEWLISVQTPELLSKDTPVPGMQDLVNCIPKSVYLTSRSEIHLDDTLKWLRIHNFPPRQLIMRSKDDVRSYSEFKEEAVKEKLRQLSKKENSLPQAYNVIIVDDDPKAKLEKVCENNGWVLLKARSGGKVL